jgi:catalase
VSVRNYQRGEIDWLWFRAFRADCDILFSLDGRMTVTDNQGGAPNYYPNSFSGPEPSEEARALEPAYRVSGDVYRFDSGDEDNFTQPRVFWNSVLDQGERKRLVTNIADQLGNAAEFIQERAVANFSKVSEDFGKQLTKALMAKRGNKLHDFYHFQRNFK